jgi:hypothetical protein
MKKINKGNLYRYQTDGKIYVEFFIPLKIYEMTSIEVHPESIEKAEFLLPLKLRGDILEVKYIVEDGKAKLI